MNVDISIWGVIVSAIAAMIIGMVWYSPSVFGKSWMKIIGLTDKEMKQRSGFAMAAMVVTSILTAYVLSLFIAYQHAFTGQSWVNSGWETAFFAWLGFAATAIFAHGIFEPRDKKVIYINVGNRLVTLIAMGLIIGLFMR